MDNLSRPEGSGARPRSLNETIHLIRKLRWMGLDDGAKRLEAEVAVSRAPPGGNVVGVPPHGLNETIHLIRKLRWRGLDEEAKRQEAEMAVSRAPPGDNVVGGSRDTD